MVYGKPIPLRITPQTHLQGRIIPLNTSWYHLDVEFLKELYS